MRAWVIALLVAGCGGDDDGPPPDAAPDGDSVEIAEPIAPMAASPPRIEQCPEGWAMRTDDRGLAYCDPFPAADAAPCTGATARFTHDACAPIGATCPADGWPATLPEGRRAWFVRAGAEAGGDGSRARPFPTITAGLAASTSGDVIAIGEGTYREQVRIDRPLALIGACAEGTTLVAPNTLETRAAVLIVARAQVSIENLRVDGDGRFPGLAFDDGDVTLAGVLVERASTFGVAVRDGELDVSHLVVRDTRAPPDVGAAIVVQRAVVDVAHVRIDGSDSKGVHIVEGSHLRGEDLVIRDAHGGPGFGLAVQDHSSAQLVGLGVEHALSTALIASEGSAVDIESARLVDGATTCVIGGSLSRIVLRRSSLDRCQATGILMERSQLELEDVAITHTQTSIGREGGFGLLAYDTASIEVTRVAIDDNRSAGVVISGPASMRGSDLLVRGTLPDPLDREGGGLNVQDGATLELERALIEGNHVTGVTIGQAEQPTTATHATIRDLIVRDTAPQAAGGDFGYGVDLGSGAELTLERALLEGNHAVGMTLFDGASLVATDLVVSGTLARPNDGTLGRGVTIDQSRARIERARIARSYEVGVLGLGESTIELVDVRVLDTMERACAIDGCATTFGIGMGFYSGTNATLERFEVRRAALCGIHLANHGDVSAIDGVIADNPFGVCAEAIDRIEALQSGARYEGNGMNLIAREIEVPDPTPPPL